MLRPIILDCDPGHDDAVALLLALASPELEVLAVTVTHGNVPLERTLHNALSVCALAGSGVPVYAGADRPLLRGALHASHVHGESGLGDVVLPAPTRGPNPGRAADVLIETALARPGELTLVATGPLTNVALALRLEPRLAETLREIVLMGGSAGSGNVTPAAEFNFHADPHAARIVFESGAPITMFGLNATEQVPVTGERAEQLRAVNNPPARAAAAMLDDYLRRLTGRGHSSDGALHDPCTVAFLLRPDLFTLQDTFVQIDAEEGPDFGRSLCDLKGVLGRESNARVALGADANGFYDLLTQALARCGAPR